MPPIGAPDFAFIGHAGSGKSTAAQFLHDHQGYRCVSFATPLKAVARELWGADAATDRHKLQALGPAIRAIDPGTFPDLAIAAIGDDPRACWAVDDCRFENEAAVLEAIGFTTVRLTVPRDAQITRLTRNGKFQTEEQLDHASETTLDRYPVKYEFHNDGDVMDLYEFLIHVVTKEIRR